MFSINRPNVVNVCSRCAQLLPVRLYKMPQLSHSSMADSEGIQSEGGGGRDGGRERERQTDRQTDRQAGRQAGRQTDRQADRQADRQTERDRDMDRDKETERSREGGGGWG